MWMNSHGEGNGPTGTSISAGSRRAKASRSAAPNSCGVRARAAGGAETFGVFDEIGIGEVGGDQAVAEAFLLDAADIAEGAVDKHNRHQWNAVADGGRHLVAGVKEAAVAVDRQHRHIRPRLLRAERGGIAPAEIVLIAGRQESARLVDRHGEARDKADLRDFVDENAVLRQRGADGLEESELRG